MSGLFKAAAVLAVGAGAWFGYQALRPAPTPEQAVEAARERTAAAAATPITLTEPQALQFALPMGSAWKETVRGTATTRIHTVGRADETVAVGIDLVANVHTLARVDGAPGFAVQSDFAEVRLQFDITAGPRRGETLEDRLESAAESDEALRVTELRGPLGQLESIVLEGGHEEDAIDALIRRTSLLTLVSAPAGLPPQPVNAGGRWSHSYSTALIPGATFTTSSLLDHFEELAGERAAVIRTDVSCGLPAPIPFGMWPEPQMVLPLTLRSLEITGTDETRVSLAEGRFLSSEREATARFEFLASGTAPTGRPFERSLRGQIELEFVSECERMPSVTPNAPER